MKGVGIICEYNPFHFGHLYQIERIKERLPNHAVVALMSGNFTQRGEAAVCDKFSRANAAVLCGADLVLELPFPFCSLSAEGFAAAGVGILSALDGMEYICFGAEDNDKELFERTADALLSDGFENTLRKTVKTSPQLSFPLQRELALKESYGLDAGLLRRPNNILAVEYIKAIKRQGSHLVPYIIKRDGGDFDSASLDTPRPSAFAIRQNLIKGENVSKYMPTPSYHCLKKALFPDMGRLDTLFVHSLLSLSEERLYEICGSAELAGRLLLSARNNIGIQAICTEALSKKFTMTRLRRTVLNIIFNISHKEFLNTPPAFTRLLAAGKRGREFLGGKHKTEIITKMADAKINNIRLSELYRISDCIYASLCGKETSYFIKSAPRIL